MVKTTEIEQKNISWTIRIPRSQVRTRVNDKSYFDPEVIVKEIDSLFEKVVESEMFLDLTSNSVIQQFTEQVDENFPDLAFSVSFTQDNEYSKRQFFIFVVAW